MLIRVHLYSSPLRSKHFGDDASYLTPSITTTNALCLHKEFTSVTAFMGPPRDFSPMGIEACERKLEVRCKVFKALSQATHRTLKCRSKRRPLGLPNQFQSSHYKFCSSLARINGLRKGGVGGGLRQVIKSQRLLPSDIPTLYNRRYLPPFTATSLLVNITRDMSLPTDSQG